MIITSTVTKKIIESIVQETFSNLGHISASFLLDSLKLLGFYYATNAGISINIEDLKTPKAKNEQLTVASLEVKKISDLWAKGFVTDEERFQCIIDNWNFATEALKDKIINYYQKFDPANNLYIMAFSGARGNISQVRQLVGMRGLMSDQEGKIIDLPISTNFREGLSSIDYMISSYGARKGIVDTALKTADSGYLTRRLIYVAQDLVIREINCNSQNGVIFLLTEKLEPKALLGRFILRTKSAFEVNKLENFSCQMVTNEVLKELKKQNSLIVKIRSPLSCLANGSVCQYCYGWDLAQKKIVALGEAVGIIAAQSIGEPGTQLTMRTFHTGGIFTSELLKQTFIPFSGQLKPISELKSSPYRTQYGTLALKLQQEAVFRLTNWKGLESLFVVKRGSFVHLKNHEFVKKGSLAFEYPKKSVSVGERRMKPLYTRSTGEIQFENFSISELNRKEKTTININEENGVLWVAKGKLLTIPKEARTNFTAKISTKKALASLQIVTPFSGIVSILNNCIFITSHSQIFSFNLLDLLKETKGYRIHFLNIVKNFQYVDAFSTLGYINIFPKISEKIYSNRKKESLFDITHLFIGKSSSWKTTFDQPNVSRNLMFPQAGAKMNDLAIYKNPGFLIKQDGFIYIYQQATPHLASRGTILNLKQGDFFLKNELLGTLVNYTHQTEDIVQGLPKIEEIIEARVPKLKAELAKMPGILLKETKSFFESTSLFAKPMLLSYISSKNELKHETINSMLESTRVKNREIFVFQNFGVSKNLAFYAQKIWKVSLLPVGFFPFQLAGKKDLCFINNSGMLLKISIGSKKLGTGWTSSKCNHFSSLMFKEGNFASKTLLTAKKAFQFQNKKSNDFILKFKDSSFLFFEELNTVSKYSASITAQILQKPGSFLDLGEPFTEGMLNPHELLLILFNYHLFFDGLIRGTVRSLNKFQLILVNSIQAIYQSQGVAVSSKHIEIIIRQMTSKILIKEAGDTPLLPGELLSTSLIVEILKSLTKNSKAIKYQLPKYEPLFLSATNSSLNKDGFLSAAGFQETKRVLTRAAIYGNSDWLRGLKECVLLGRLIPAGSTFLNYKNYLDNIYLFKD